MSTGLQASHWIAQCDALGLSPSAARGVIAALLVIDGRCDRAEALCYVRAWF